MKRKGKTREQRYQRFYGKSEFFFWKNTRGRSTINERSEEGQGVYILQRKKEGHFWKGGGGGGGSGIEKAS